MEGRHNMASHNREEKENEKESSMDVDLDLEWQTPERGTVFPGDQVTANESIQAADEPLA